MSEFENVAPQTLQNPVLIGVQYWVEDGHMKLTELELYRRASGLSQAALAEHLGPGFTASAISLMESQRLKPSPRQWERLREVFGDQAEAILRPVDPAHVAAPIGEPS
jgi:hypothetical protein